MDSHTKTGKVYLQPRKAGKKWKPVLLSLVPASNNGVGRLEIQFIGGGGGGRDHVAGLKKHHQPQESKVKVVRLSELISVLRLPPNAEACPMENMSAFCVESQERTMVFSTEKDDCVEWVEKLCQATFQKDAGSNTKELHMEENLIYATANALEFYVVVQRTDAAIRCGLLGSYWLQVGPRTLLLKDIQKVNIVRQWPYELLRRYGKDKLTLTIEAGRRCDSGPGTFTFETQQSEKIFNLIQSTIKQKTLAVSSGNLHQEEDKSVVTNILAKSPLPEIPDMTGIASILENRRLQVKTEDNVGARNDAAHSSENKSLQPAPITLMPLPMVPKLDKPSGDLHDCQSEAEYANPADCIQNVQIPKVALSYVYVDPASVLPLHPPKESLISVSNSLTPQPCVISDESVYSEVYDKVIINDPKQFAEDEPIYTVPVSKATGAPEKDETKPDPFAHLYAQVNKTPPSSSPSSTPPPPSSSSLANSMAATKISDPSPDDVIYENLGII
ncbi:docking protein 1 [Corythoichthys intestinalis]|uniref:docking protein 1 n=1 Tax=Corythoichthys intestinalis TaxID=161448 RepID=UPI0025A63397|nr:docking protein 1 [Corythoichthys intestinalis]XP_061791611.1 docking protein 1 [Nerophis lumbriciformis]